MKNILIAVVKIIALVAAQPCREYGKTCNDDKACCGGCCMQGICKDTYADCRVWSSPCLDYFCDEDQDCYVYQPEDCEGCGSYPVCRDSPPAPSENIIIKPSIPVVRDSSGNVCCLRNLVLIACLLLFIKVL